MWSIVSEDGLYKHLLYVTNDVNVYKVNIVVLMLQQQQWNRHVAELCTGNFADDLYTCYCVYSEYIIYCLHDSIWLMTAWCQTKTDLLQAIQYEAE